MKQLSYNSLKILTLSVVLLSLGGCFDSDDDDKDIVEVNVPPTAADADLITQTETDIVDMLPVTDSNGDTLTFNITSEPSIGSLSVASDGSFTYSPFAEQTGMDSFTYSVSDGIAAPVSATINITIEALQLSFSDFSREAFNQALNDEPLSVNGRAFTQDVVNQNDYQDLIDAN